jgi:tRNA threonylcarbamoyladenosine biosynthesis protein TsaE
MSSSSHQCELSGVDIAKLERLASDLNKSLPRRLVIGLRGTLGAGKTRFVQAFASAAGVPQGDVTSPTFPIVQHYHGERLIHHIDAYRLADEDEFAELGGEELLEEDATILIEWPDRIKASLPSDLITIDFEVDEDPATRSVRIAGSDATIMGVIARLCETL